MGDEAWTARGLSRTQKIQKALEDIGVTGIEVRPEVIIGGSNINIDLIIPSKRLAIKVSEPVTIDHDVRFNQKKSILERNKILLEGDETYTLSKHILNKYIES